MCYFLTIAVPTGAKLTPPSPEYGAIDFLSTNNPAFRSLISDRWSIFFVTTGGCSCDLCQRAVNLGENKEERLIKLKRKGWSDNKIARALSNQTRAQRRVAGLRADVLDAIAKFVTTHSSVRLYLHWFAGNIETEFFEPRDLGLISMQDFRSDSAILQEDTTILICKTALRQQKAEP